MSRRRSSIARKELAPDAPISIHMRDYRRQAIERIVSRCTEQHGVVLAHTFGTGKTLTIGVLLKNFPSSWAKILLAPVDLHEQWRIVSNTLSLDLEIYDIYKPAPPVRQPEVLVVDEAHLLIPYVDSVLVKRFGAATKLVLATGTPYVEDIASSHVLLNLAAGKPVIPSDPDVFSRKYMNVSKTASALYGWILPIGEHIFKGVIFNRLVVNYLLVVYAHFFGGRHAVKGVTAFIITSLLWKIAYLSTAEARRDLRILDARKFAHDVSPYLLIFDPFKSDGKDVVQHFPIPLDMVEYTTLNSYQLLQLQRMAKNKLDFDLLKSMQVVKNQEEMAAFVQRLADQQKLMDNMGRMAGNLAKPGQQPKKFVRILKMHEITPMPTVVYSNFERGAELFIEAVAADGRYNAKVYSSRADLDEALARRIDFLILPPASTQGIDLPGILRMHILEPVSDAATFSQLRARIIRYIHNATERKEVQIIQWVAKLPVGHFLSIPAVSAIFEYWKQYEKSLMPTETIANTVLTSPDQTVFARLQKALKEFRAVESVLLRASKHGQLPNAQCSLWEPGPNVDPRNMPSCEEFWSHHDSRSATTVAGRSTRPHSPRARSRKSKRSKNTQRF